MFYGFKLNLVQLLKLFSAAHFMGVESSTHKNDDKGTAALLLRAAVHVGVCVRV